MAKAHIMVILQQYVKTKMVLSIVFHREIYAVSFFAWFQYLPTEFTRKSFSRFPVCLLRISFKYPSCVGCKGIFSRWRIFSTVLIAVFVRCAILYFVQYSGRKMGLWTNISSQNSSYVWPIFFSSFRKKKLAKKLNDGKGKKEIDR